MTIYLASDHAAVELKEDIKAHLRDRGIAFQDMGTHSADSVDWPEYGAKAAAKVSGDPEGSRGIILCGSGIGMSMVSNKFKNVRAALCNDPYAAEMSRRHNNANVLNMGARVVDKQEAMTIVDTWLDTPFDGGRHQKRLDVLTHIVEDVNFK